MKWIRRVLCCALSILFFLTGVVVQASLLVDDPSATGGSGTLSFGSSIQGAAPLETDESILKSTTTTTTTAAETQPLSSIVEETWQTEVKTTKEETSSIVEEQNDHHQQIQQQKEKEGENINNDDNLSQNNEQPINNEIEKEPVTEPQDFLTRSDEETTTYNEAKHQDKSSLEYDTVGNSQESTSSLSSSFSTLSEEVKSPEQVKNPEKTIDSPEKPQHAESEDTIAAQETKHNEKPANQDTVPQTIAEPIPATASVETDSSNAIGSSNDDTGNGDSDTRIKQVDTHLDSGTTTPPEEPPPSTTTGQVMLALNNAFKAIVKTSKVVWRFSKPIVYQLFEFLVKAFNNSLQVVNSAVHSYMNKQEIPLDHEVSVFVPHKEAAPKVAPSYLGMVVNAVKRVVVFIFQTSTSLVVRNQPITEQKGLTREKVTYSIGSFVWKSTVGKAYSLGKSAVGLNGTSHTNKTSSGNNTSVAEQDDDISIENVGMNDAWTTIKVILQQTEPFVRVATRTAEQAVKLAFRFFILLMKWIIGMGTTEANTAVDSANGTAIPGAAPPSRMFADILCDYLYATNVTTTIESIPQVPTVPTGPSIASNEAVASTTNRSTPQSQQQVVNQANDGAHKEPVPVNNRALQQAEADVAQQQEADNAVGDGNTDLQRLSPEELIATSYTGTSGVLEFMLQLILGKKQPIASDTSAAMTQGEKANNNENDGVQDVSAEAAAAAVPQKSWRDSFVVRILFYMLGFSKSEPEPEPKPSWTDTFGVRHVLYMTGLKSRPKPAPAIDTTNEATTAEVPVDSNAASKSSSSKEKKKKSKKKDKSVAKKTPPRCTWFRYLTWRCKSKKKLSEFVEVKEHIRCSWFSYLFLGCKSKTIIKMIPRNITEDEEADIVDPLEDDEDEDEDDEEEVTPLPAVDVNDALLSSNHNGTLAELLDINGTLSYQDGMNINATSTKSNKWRVRIKLPKMSWTNFTYLSYVAFGFCHWFFMDFHQESSDLDRQNFHWYIGWCIIGCHLLTTTIVQMLVPISYFGAFCLICIPAISFEVANSNHFSTLFILLLGVTVFLLCLPESYGQAVVALFVS